MITAGINLLIISLLVLIIGLINPKWLLVWVEKPGRMPIVMIAVALFMIAMVLFGEGTKRKQEALTAQNEQPAQQSDQKPAEKVKIVPAQELIK